MISEGRKSFVPFRARNGASAETGVTDSEVFETWVAPHWSAMRRLAERLAGRDQRDDVLQEALAAAWRSRSTFDSTRGTAHSWLLGITANHAKKAWRFTRRHEAFEEAPTAGTDSDGLDVQRAVRALPTRQRLAVELFYFVGLPVSEVASVMRCAEGTVKSTLSAARANLRDALGEDY